MKKLFLQITILLNFAAFNTFCMEEEQIKKIDLPQGYLFIDEQKNLNVYCPTLIIKNAIEIVESPTKTFAIAIAEEKNHNKEYKTKVFLINYKAYTTYNGAGIRTVRQFSANELGTRNDKYKTGNCHISQDGGHIIVNIGGAKLTVVNNICN